MIAKRPGTRLLHILEELDGVAATTQGMTIDQVLDTYTSRRTLERALQIISEAAKELPPEVRSMEPDVPWQSIISMGNYLRHEYHLLDRTILIGVLSTGLPTLRPVIERLIAQLQAGQEAQTDPQGQL